MLILRSFESTLLQLMDVLILNDLARTKIVLSVRPSRKVALERFADEELDG